MSLSFISLSNVFLLLLYIAPQLGLKGKLLFTAGLSFTSRAMC